LGGVQKKQSGALGTMKIAEEEERGQQQPDNTSATNLASGLFILAMFGLVIYLRMRDLRRSLDAVRSGNVTINLGRRPF
jgi:hypothetical protein